MAGSNASSFFSPNITLHPFSFVTSVFIASLPVELYGTLNYTQGYMGITSHLCARYHT